MTPQLDLSPALWQRYDAGPVALWARGAPRGRSMQALAAALASGPAALAAAPLTGHYALVAQGPGWTAARADRIAAVPIAWIETPGGTVIGDRAGRLVERLGDAAIDPDAALAVAMMGYAIGTAALHRGLHRLGPGETLLVGEDGKARRAGGTAYRPWRAAGGAEAAWLRRLREVTLGVLERLAGEGRPIVVPLSAGLDSRLVLAGLRHVGHRDLFAYTYGRPDSHEAAGARAVAERLGVPWAMIPLDHAAVRAQWRDPAHDAWLAFADSDAATPVDQGWHAARRLRDQPWWPAGALVVNGQSGDFLTGGHIPLALAAPQPGEPWPRLFRAIVAKHAALWPALRTPDRLARIETPLRRQLDAIGAPWDRADGLAAAYEASEHLNRQVNFVVPGQRIYDALELDWRLPLWDDAWIDLWEEVPLALKVGQRLYRRMLEESDWGGVWRDLAAPRFVSPAWLRGPRLALRAAAAPFGRDAWHRVERRFLAYWMDANCEYDIVRWRDLALSPRDFRNPISWMTRAYLARKGLAWDGARPA